MALLDIAERAARAAAASFVNETGKPVDEALPAVFGEAGEVTVIQAAAELGLSEQWVRRLAADGRLAGRRVGRAWQIDAATVAALALETEADGQQTDDRQRGLGRAPGRAGPARRREAD